CYKTTTFYHAESERVVSWDDAAFGIEWPSEMDDPILSERDRNAPSFADAELTT
ncbi:MAG: dTDP-4-dehydrorhamnose 3,5-epimerase, partial [Acidimicrobiia bacterium]|nr:dTDP-4-dehydrorhamnose 3,5-epimerase [Acidimicrobiia bacterium]